MFTIDGTIMLEKLVDFHLNRNIPAEYDSKNDIIKKPGIIFPIKLSAESPDMKRSAHVELLTLFFGNTSVCYSPVENMLRSDEEFLNSLNWINTCNHDSCWRSDGLRFLTKYYFDMCEKVAPDIAPIEVPTEMSIGWMSFKVINVEVHFNHKPEGYWINIKKIRVTIEEV